MAGRYRVPDEKTIRVALDRLDPRARSIVYIWVCVGVLAAIWVVTASSKFAIKPCYFGPHTCCMLCGSMETHVRIRVALDILYAAFSALGFTKRSIPVSYCASEIWVSWHVR